MSVPQTTRQIWTAPIVLGMVSAIGQLSALLGDGLWDALSWVALTAPIAAVLWFVVRTISHSLSLMCSDPAAIFAAHIKFSKAHGLQEKLMRVAAAVPGLMKKSLQHDY